MSSLMEPIGGGLYIVWRSQTRLYKCNTEYLFYSFHQESQFYHSTGEQEQLPDETHPEKPQSLQVNQTTEEASCYC